MDEAWALCPMHCFGEQWPLKQVSLIENWALKGGK